MAISKDHEMVRPEIRALIERGKITVDEIKELYCNSYEWDAMVPALSIDALIQRTEQAIHQLRHPRVPALTYDESVCHVFAPELIRRLLLVRQLSDRTIAELAEARAQIKQMEEDDRLMEAREEYDT
jgi:hypothetical protein